jgi:hypothetical protein
VVLLVDFHAVNILKASTGANHMVIGWIENDGRVFAGAVVDPPSFGEAQTFLMRIASDTEKVIAEGRKARDGETFFCQLWGPASEVVWLRQKGDPLK